MENEQNLELEQVNNEETGEAAVVEPASPPKPKLTPEQELGIKRRSFSRLAEELGVEVERPWLKKPESPKSQPAEKTSFDDTEQLFLDVKQVPNEDRDYLWNEHRQTGKPLRQLVDFKYIQEELRGRLESRKSTNAMPEDKGRTGSPMKNTLDYWLPKVEAGEVPISQVPDSALRKQILNERYKKERTKINRF